MYFKPRIYNCPKCHSELMWSEHHDPFGFGIPFCLHCYKEFLQNNVPIMLEKKK